MSTSLAQIREDFLYLDDWEDRFRYVIELGRDLAPLSDADRTEASRVSGCSSQVWIITRLDRSGPTPCLIVRGDSDALIVKGLVAIAIATYSGKPPADILALDDALIFSELGFRDQLTRQRSNGLASIIARIRADAAAALTEPA